MACACIRGDKFNFHVTAYKEAIIFTDFSDWNRESPYIVPKDYTLDITLPERMKPIRVKVSLNGKILPSDLGISKIPDGIFKFSLVGCGEEIGKGCCGVIYHKHVLLYPTQKCCLIDAYARLDFDEVEEVESFFLQSEIQVELGMIKEAQKTYMIGQKKLKSLNCDCPC